MKTETTRRSTGIEWTGHTWNPFVGCSINSPGCTNCYAMRQAHRIQKLQGTRVYDGTTRLTKGGPVWSGKINRATPATWRKPLTIADPSLIFVNSMSDFFHPGAPDDWRLEALGIMAATPHQYQILTKLVDQAKRFLHDQDAELPENVWVGASVERADFRFRIDQLREIPATIRFLSIEPLIGRIGKLDLSGIHWVIAGGESGPKARGMHSDWVREVRDECDRQGVAFFFKQWGQLINNPLFIRAITAGMSVPEAMQACRINDPEYHEDGTPRGKGGCLLDDREHRDYPTFFARAA